jgi:drug/metabolite transporter (DMT)-like permease
VILAVGLAFAAAASFAAGSALQHRVAGAESAADESRLAFLRRLARRPSWLVGLLLSALAFGLHAAALSQGDLALVQPVIVSGIVFAVLIRSGLARRLPPARTLVWLVLTWVGLAVFLFLRPEAAGRSVHLGRAAVMMAVGAGLAVVLMLAARRTSVERRRGLLLGAVAGTLFGLVAGDVKLVFSRLGEGLGSVLGYWPLWTLVVLGLWAVLVNQRAYQAARLSVTAPVLNIAEVLVAIAFGMIVFGESAHSSTGQLVGEAVGLALVITGVVKLASATADRSDDDDRELVPAGADERGSTAD